MYTTKDKLFYEDLSSGYTFVSADKICENLLYLNIKITEEIKWFYCEYTKGYTLLAANDNFRIWSVKDIEKENKQTEVTITPYEFYFSDVTFRCYCLYFKSIDDFTTEVWGDYHQNGKHLLSPSIREWIYRLNSNWDDGLYNCRLPN